MIGNAQDMSGAEARRVALRAQGFGRPRPQGEPTPRQVRAVVSSLGAVQLDAVTGPAKAEEEER